MRNSGAATGPACPVCGTASRRTAELSKQFLTAALEEFVEARLPAAVQLHDYAMCRCPGCSLEFADPLAPADDAFYAWLDREAKYYVGQRWEWDRVAELVAASRPSPSVLEFGSGDAKFLKRLQQTIAARTVAIERSPMAVAALRADGVEAYAWDETGSTLAGRHFDFVLAFHCLEHVPDPVAMLRRMMGCAGPDGRVLFSLPYSPMYFESHWFDPLNHPPHHLSRWNARALARLAERCGGRARLQLPTAYAALHRARYSLAIQRLGPHWQRRRIWRWQPLLHPLRFAGELGTQLRRERVDGRMAADVVLVEIERYGRRASIT